jgi:TolB-like protein/DNA-binding winged helix-turn-helix (wHTH) protein
MAETLQSRRVHFSDFEVNLRSGELRKCGRKVRLQEKPFQILALLLEQPGELVAREEMRQKLWPADTFVDFDHSLGTAISKLRQALIDSPQNPRFIETVASRGYRFVGPTEGVNETLSRPAIFAGEPLAEPAPAKGAHGANLFPRWIAISVAGLVGGALLVAIFLGFDIGGAREWLRLRSNRPVHSLAVLPLENLSGDPSEDYFADGMTDDLITSLAQLGSMQVISRTSVMQYKGTKKSLPQIARELHVDAVVEGTVLRSGQRVRISAQLVDAARDEHLWAQTYERDLRDILSLQGEVASAIAGEIRIKLTPQERVRMSAARPVNPGAHIAYLKAQYLLNNERSPYGAKKSLEYSQQAVQIDPGDALAYAGLAESYINGENFVLGPTKEVMPKAKEAAEKALELNPDLSEAHVALGMVLSNYDFDWSGAESEFKRAIELSASSSFAHQQYADFLETTGRIKEAISEIRLAQRLDPLSFWISLAVGRTLYVAREYDQALEALRQAADMNPRSPGLYLWMSFAYDKKGMAKESMEMELKRLSILGKSEEKLRRLREAYNASGQAGYLRKKLELLKELNKEDNYGLAMINARLGKRDEAFQALEKAYKERSAFMSFVKVDPELDSLHSDPRFQELLRKMGLSP